MGNPTVPKDLADFTRSFTASDIVPMVMLRGELVVVPVDAEYNGLHIMAAKRRLYDRAQGHAFVSSSLTLTYLDDIQVGPDCSLLRTELVQEREDLWVKTQTLRLKDENGEHFEWQVPTKATVQDLNAGVEVLSFAGNRRLRNFAHPDKRVNMDANALRGEFIPWSSESRN